MSVSGTPRRLLTLAAAAGLMAPPAQTVYCYVTIADDDCYAAPQPGQEARLIRAWPPDLQRPSPSAKAAAGAP
ncbi:MAG: hypothetical protein O3A96_02890 [Proteobacteria bacterium]|nr:hypothetical protein [Pseudomonadota bacterium]